MPNVGEVRYKVVADTSGLDKQISETEKKTKKIGDTAEKTSEKIKSSSEKARKKIKENTDESAKGYKKSTEEAKKFADAIGKVPEGEIGQLNADIKETQRELNKVNKALKETPDDIELLSEKYQDQIPGLTCEKIREMIDELVKFHCAEICEGRLSVTESIIIK